jgi:hypothetical protein
MDDQQWRAEQRDVREVLGSLRRSVTGPGHREASPLASVIVAPEVFAQRLGSRVARDAQVADLLGAPLPLAEALRRIVRRSVVAYQYLERLLGLA